MATKASVAKQKRREKMVDLKWDARQALKKIISNPATSYEDKLAAVDKLNKLPKNSSPVRLRSRCQLTGRSRGVLKKYQLSRLCFREMANSGLIPGVFKASW
jgi:small subunit ribosomal protein S14